ncbi:putative disease resistance protein At3g14460 isoform X3 [Miscanthus floridulus]|uniref:putative disease resistance protein At3g14460 isoform X3 n=1 Tax=Miscanthus floridulus TaxID=154761 RepID=UPI00345B3B75
MDSREILELENKLLDPTTEEPISLPLHFLRSITNGFSNEQELGRGGYGVVYKGRLLHHGDSFIAVKKFHDSHVVKGDEQFQKVATSLIKHPNVTQLLGYCSESKGEMTKLPNGKSVIADKQTRILCFEYMCNGGLDEHLSGESSGLDWNKRYKIIKGICSGLEYLHGCNIIHLDLKPQNILMDATMMPKIADFDLSRLLGEQKSQTVTKTANPPGTRGYMAPEYIDRGVISKKADIFSLGVIIIEIQKGCKDDYPDYGQSTEVFQHFTEKVLSNWRNRFERSSKYTSPELHTQLVKQCINIALECVHPEKEKRPNVSNIIEILNAAEGSCVQNGEDLLVDHQIGAQEGVLQPDVQREDGLMDHRPAWITKGIMKSAAAPLQPHRKPVLESVDGSLCYQGSRNASFWVAHKALASLEDNVLKDWAATINLGPGVTALQLELLSVKAILESTLGKVIHNSALEHCLMMLQDLVYDAEDVVDEMEYFHIQDMLDASQHAEGCAHNLDLNVLPSIHDEPPKLRFDRDNASRRIEHIVEQMQLIEKKFSSAIKLLGSDWSTTPNIAQNRPITISESIEPKLYGRELMMKRITDDITKGKHCHGVLTVIPIVGPGGIGKTTLAQHIYHSGEVQEHFDVRVWTCVSLNFNVNKLIEEIQRYIPKVDRESSNGTASELIGQRLKNKRLLLVLDDIWDCSDEDEWKQLLVPFKKSQVQAKTVGRLLKTQLDLVHWTRVLESKQWEHSNGKNDIMPALKLSFDYLRPQLQQCFSYCALFPQDYRFEREGLINFWIGQEALHYSPHGESKRVEDIGLSHLTELVNYGFLEDKGEKIGITFYIIHDLLHELARKVSSLECLSIDTQSQVSSLQIPTSIRHLSINIDDTSVNNRLTQKNCVEDINTLHTRLKVEKLQTLMIFGIHHGCFVKAFGDLFREAKALRVILLSDASYDVEYLLCNFYSLLHLRYLRIDSSSLYKARFPNKISRFYHMMVLDAEHCDIINLPRDVSNLVKLRHLLVQHDTIHSSITEVGKLKSLQELRRFMVEQDDQGFELRQIGHLEELCGSLCIDSLENVQVPEEADEAKLMLKSHLHELILRWNDNWSTDDSALEKHVLERLKPSRDLQKLSIIGHRGGTCPSWLGLNLSLGSLKSLCLDDVNWKTFPPIGDLWLVDVPREEISINIPEKRFGNLRRLDLIHLSGLKTWAVHAPCQLFPYLEVLIIRDCSQLVELSFSHSAGCCQQGKDANDNLFPRLKELKIKRCPQLLSFAPIPWTEAPCYIEITGISSLDKLVYGNENSYLTIEGNNKDTNDSTVWDVLAFHNLTGLEVLRLYRCQSLPLHYLQMLSSLRTLRMSYPSNVFPLVEADSHVKYQFPVESLVIEGERSASGKELTQLLVYFPKLSDLELQFCAKVTGLAVNVRGQHATETPGTTTSANKEDQQQDARANVDVIVVSEEAEHGLLILPPQLQVLEIRGSPKLRLLGSNPHDDSNKDGRTRQGGGLWVLSSLRRLEIEDCPELLSSYSSSSFSSSFPLPNSLEHLRIRGAMGTGAQLPLSNLTALTSLSIYRCGDLRGEGLWSLLAQGHLNELSVQGTPNFFVDSEQEIPSCSSKLQRLEIDDVAGFTAAAIRHSLLFSSLTILSITDHKLKSFTEEQEALLFVDSLGDITFHSCHNLQSLPERLPRHPNLKRLHIWTCGAIQMLPKEGLPSSLQDLYISNCPQIQSLPKLDDLPSSLRYLNVRDSGSEELRRQCRKLINIIPIVEV